ncbi:hypothetical protein EPUL_004095 [Erysiphe pulchra]|uniref:gluconokinase n=1 Tax=Erysiphe pulchra TaxID=225359 RepID=A0A2S4PS30_9PEZI|nr:hypothetical protein EPUL_004095 [Erysiphe pulchra]
MAQGIPLTDADRWDWLVSLRQASLDRLIAGHHGVVLTCSALKRKYRDVIRVAPYYFHKIRIHFFYLDAAESVLLTRVQARKSHFMGANMVHSQFTILEPPDKDEKDVSRLDVGRPLEQVQEELLSHVFNSSPHLAVPNKESIFSPFNGRTVEESARKAQLEVDNLLDWVRHNAVHFDSQKSEVIQFQGRRQEAPTNIQINGRVIDPAEHRWLGIYLDKLLNFIHHVATWSSKALKISQQLRRLDSVKRGAAPRALITAIDTCVVPVVIFGAEVWWPGMTRPTRKGNSTSQTTHLCNLIDKVIHQGLRAALPLPVWETTPNGIRLRLAAKINSLDDRHPLRTRATRAYRQLPPAEAAEPLTKPCYCENIGNKSQGAEAHTHWANRVESTEICAYSDGSSEGHGRSSWGHVLKRAGETFRMSSGILHGGEIYDAELCGATMALLAALSTRIGNEKIFVLLDNQAAVRALKTRKKSSCLRLTQSFHDVARKSNVEVRWVPGHSKITGNEEADSEARKALRLLPARDSTPVYITLAYLRRLMNQRRQKLIDDWWLKACPIRYQDLELQMRRRKPPELTLPRHTLHHLLAARTGHRDLAAYHRRFHHIDANLICECGQETTPTYFIRCRTHASTTRKLRKGMKLEKFTKQLLGHNC